MKSIGTKFEHVRRIQPSAKFDEIGRGSNRPRTCLPLQKLKINADLGPLPGRFSSYLKCFFNFRNFHFHYKILFCLFALQKAHPESFDSLSTILHC